MCLSWSEYWPKFTFCLRSNTKPSSYQHTCCSVVGHSCCCCLGTLPHLLPKRVMAMFLHFLITKLFDWELSFKSLRIQALWALFTCNQKAKMQQNLAFLTIFLLCSAMCSVQSFAKGVNEISYLCLTGWKLYMVLIKTSYKCLQGTRHRVQRMKFYILANQKNCNMLCTPYMLILACSPITLRPQLLIMDQVPILFVLFSLLKEILQPYCTKKKPHRDMKALQKSLPISVWSRIWDGTLAGSINLFDNDYHAPFWGCRSFLGMSTVYPWLWEHK